MSLVALLFVGGSILPTMAAGANKDIAAITADYNAGRNLPALEKCMAVLRREPNNIDVHYLLGNVFLRLDKLENAYEEYDFCATRGKTTATGKLAAQAMARMRELAAQAPDPNNQSPTQSTQSQPTQNFPVPPRDMQTAVTPPPQPQQPTPTGPRTKSELQAEEKRDAAAREGAAFISAKRRTLDAQVKHLNDDAKLAIRDVPKYVYMSNHRVPNPDYDSIVQSIKDECATKVQMLQDDCDRESAKINNFYKGLSDSYGKAPSNLQSQGDDGRSGHKMTDQDPSMYVQNFGGGRGSRRP